MNFFEKLHNKALEAARDFKKKESELIEDIMAIDKYKAFMHLGYSSLFQYCLSGLKLTENQSYQFIGIARKSVEIPEIKQAIENGKINVSNARRIVPVITKENKDLWIEKAASLPQRELEMEIVKVKPESIKKEVIKPVVEDKYEMRTYLSKEDESNLKRIKDILSQKFKRAVTAQEAISYLMQDFLKRQDPVQKAERALSKQDSDELYLSTVEKDFARVSHTFTKRQPLPAHIKHQINLRDKNRCTYTQNNQRCSNQRWLHVHHINPVANGGQNTVNNLTTLCSNHHKFLHRT